MSDLPLPPIGRRGVPGTSRTLSAVTISVDPPPVAPPAADARTVALLRRARERGVTTFDVAGARFPLRAERLIATAFPSPDPELGVIVGRSIESLAEERGPDDDRGWGGSLAIALASSLDQSRRRLAPVPVAIVEWSPGAEGSTTGPEVPGERPRIEGETKPEPLWAIRLSSRTTTLPRDPHPPALFVGEFSLLDDGVAPLFDSPGAVPGASLVARNPFGDGRLDGSRFAAVSTPGAPGQGPVDVRHLHEEFDPILRLGFLTAGRRRTLAQAALWFVLRWPWVVTCVIPLPPPERFEEVLGFAASPPLVDDELDRLNRVK